MDVVSSGGADRVPRHETVMIPCSEPECISYRSGHEAFLEPLRRGADFELEHERPRRRVGNAWVRIVKLGEGPWGVRVHTVPDELIHDVDVAREVADALVEAAAEAGSLNTRGSAASRVDG